MEASYKYKGINQSLPAIRQQIIDSVEYCYNNFSGFRTPDDLFMTLKGCTVYQHDPHQMELLQEAQTLFENNWHGIPGAGDCDCFTILAHACFIANGWPRQQIVLVGRNTKTPVHIYSRVHDGTRWRVFDLTQPTIDSEREYPYKQLIDLKFEGIS